VWPPGRQRAGQRGGEGGGIGHGKCGGQERGIAEEDGIGGFLWRGGAGEVWLGWIPFPAVDLAWPCRSSSVSFSLPFRWPREDDAWLDPGRRLGRYCRDGGIGLAEGE
jgi:hypothetical protein